MLSHAVAHLPIHLALSNRQYICSVRDAAWAFSDALYRRYEAIWPDLWEWSPLHSCWRGNISPPRNFVFVVVVVVISVWTMSDLWPLISDLTSNLWPLVAKAIDYHQTLMCQQISLHRRYSGSLLYPVYIPASSPVMTLPTQSIRLAASCGANSQLSLLGSQSMNFS